MIKKFNETINVQKDMNICVYEDNEVGAGWGLYFINLKNFDLSNDDHKKYYDAIQEALMNEDEFSYGSANTDINLHNLIDDEEITEIKLPAKIDNAVYIFTNV